MTQTRSKIRLQRVHLYIHTFKFVIQYTQNLDIYRAYYFCILNLVIPVHIISFNHEITRKHLVINTFDC